MKAQVRADSCIYTLSLPGAVGNWRGELAVTIQKSKTRFENVSGRHIARGAAFPVVNSCSRHHVLCCYSFSWCTLIEISNAQPIRSIAGADASRYCEGSGHCKLAARCNYSSSSVLHRQERTRASAGFGHIRRGVGLLTCDSGFVGHLDRSGSWWGISREMSERGKKL